MDAWMDGWVMHEWMDDAWMDAGMDDAWMDVLCATFPQNIIKQKFKIA